MKLRNHYDKNKFNLDDGTHVSGTITMTFPEYRAVVSPLQREYEKAKDKVDTYRRDSLGVSLAKVAERERTGARYIGLGICATGIIVRKYKLKLYREHNYAVLIINN